MVSSGRRAEALRDFLVDRGVSREQVDALRMPIGLDLGHTTHREVAVAVLAELVALRAAGDLPSGGGASVVRPEYRVDPVCGMSVAVDEANHPFEHAGETYYFCCPGCRYSFKKDPAQFLAQEASC